MILTSLAVPPRLPLLQLFLEIAESESEAGKNLETRGGVGAERQIRGDSAREKVK